MTPRSAHARLLGELIAKRRKECLESLVQYPVERTAGMIDAFDEIEALSMEADLKLSGGLSVSA
jgi:hypothetical protein